ncbi:DUF928 domain-containing protein [Microseira wollei]|uniref:DUF928 domain-containing protein n=1 Tax=Microseira wollei NIES-4236 TaxID=2530354 RepID=A0AAV3X362_9CYAN|nr:DUF928 domain-containing protein [Microseira wollei]GET36668.1 hypothetical protein MiSe_14200 [Microseira wollei NIES-4236]
MARKKFVFQEVRLGFAIALALATFISSPLQVRSQVARSVSNSVVAQVRFPPGDGAPTGRRRGGTSRDGCPELNKPLTALVLGKETWKLVNGKNVLDESKSFLALTVADRPTFWVYVPELPANLRAGEFVLQVSQNGEENDVYRTPLTLPEKSGVISLSLPPNPQYSLEIGKKYHWYFKVYCGNPQQTSDNFYVDVWVERVALTPELESQLKAAQSSEYIAYAANNIWYDALTNLADLRRTDAGNARLVQDWANLLIGVGLEDLAQEPIVQRYSF